MVSHPNTTGRMGQETICGYFDAGVGDLSQAERGFVGARGVDFFVETAELVCAGRRRTGEETLFWARSITFLRICACPEGIVAIWRHHPFVVCSFLAKWGDFAGLAHKSDGLTQYKHVGRVYQPPVR